MFTELQPTPPIQIFIRYEVGKSVSILYIALQRCLAVEDLQTVFSDMHPVIASILKENRKCSRDAIKRGQIAHFSEGDFVLVARGTFYNGKKLFLRWRGSPRVIKGINDYVYIVEDLSPVSCKIFTRRV